MDKKRNETNFIAQAGILAAAGIISRIIGLLYRSPLSGIIGDLGLGYYQSAYSFYLIVLLISSYSIPSAISKVIAQKLAVREYRNAHRLFHGAMIYALVVGAAASLFLWFGAGIFVEEAAKPVLRTFAPTIFIYAILGVLRGYFQAHKSMVQTSVSQILEQIANALVSVGAAAILIKTFMGTMEVPADPAGQMSRAIYGAMGSALGTGTGVFTGLVFMAVAYGVNRRDILGRVEKDRHDRVDSYGQIFRTITLVVTPFILNTAIYNASDSINTKIFTDLYPAWKSIGTDITTAHWGIFSGKANTIAKIPIAFASAMSAAMIPQISHLISTKNYEEARQKVRLGIRTTMLISIPCAVGLFVLAGPVTVFLFPNTGNTPEGYRMAQLSLMTLAPSVVFYGLSTLGSTVLQGLGKLHAPIRNGIAALLAQTAVLLLLLRFTELDVYAVAVANLVYSGVMAFLNQRSFRNAIEYRQEIRTTFALPFVSALCMGLVAYGVYRLLLALTHSPRISVLPAIAAAVPVYLLGCFLLKALSREDLRALPGGTKLIRIAEKLRLLK